MRTRKNDATSCFSLEQCKQGHFLPHQSDVLVRLPTRNSYTHSSESGFCSPFALLYYQGVRESHKSGSRSEKTHCLTPDCTLRKYAKIIHSNKTARLNPHRGSIRVHRTVRKGSERVWFDIAYPPRRLISNGKFSSTRVSIIKSYDLCQYFYN